MIWTLTLIKIKWNTIIEIISELYMKFIRALPKQNWLSFNLFWNIASDNFLTVTGATFYLTIRNCFKHFSYLLLSIFCRQPYTFYLKFALSTLFLSSHILVLCEPFPVSMFVCCSYNIPPHTPGKGYINFKILSSFSQKYTPYPCNNFCENGFQKIVQLMNIWMSLL